MPTKASKIDTVTKLIKRKSGATCAQLEKATDWKPHSVRAALSGLRKKGCVIERGKNNSGTTVYRLIKTNEQ
jgi:predicted transcriptional regulator